MPSSIAYTRTDWRTRALVDAAIMLDRHGSTGRAFTFMVEHGVADEIVARVLSLDTEKAQVFLPDDMLPSW